MSNSRKTVWIIFAIYTFVVLGLSYLIDKNQNNLDFLLRMKSYIPFMLYFSIFGTVLFLLAYLFHQLDTIKSKKLITQLENDKNQLKAKLFDMQEAKDKISPKLTEQPKAELKQENPPAKTEDDTE